MKLTVALLIAVPLTAQKQQIPSFKAGVTTVLVDTLALDADGKPVLDLTKDDFILYEDGVRQTIASFDVTDWTSYVAAETAGTKAADNATVNTYPRRFVFVVNRQGARFDWLNRAKRALRKFIVESMAEGDEAMVIEIGYSMKIVQEFRATKEDTIESVRSLSQMVVGYPLGPDRAAGQLYRDLGSLAESFAPMPGRKVVVLLSNELLTFTGPGSRRSDEGLTLKRAVDALNQANTTVYTIDLRGPESVSTLAGGLSPLATETGGRYFRNAIAFETPLRRIGRENQRYYLLGYVPENAEMDGTYRRIEVETTRPGVQIIARKGYYARAPAELATDVSESEDLVKEDGQVPAKPSRMLPDALELTSYLLPTGTGSARVPLSVALPSNLLSTKDRTLTVTLSQDGKTIRTFEQSVSLDHYYLVENVELLPGPYLMQITLEEGDEQLYQASTAFQIPAGFGERFGLSSIVPVLAPDKTGNVGDDIPILPTTAVLRGDDVYLLFQVFAGKEPPSRRVSLTYAVYDADESEIATGGKDGPMVLAGDRAGGTPVILRIPMKTLPPGTYRIDIRVEDTSLGRRATSEIEIRVR